MIQTTAMKIKRIYDEPASTDGYRVLIDRMWPRGISKQEAAIDEWNKDVAPSPELRKWFNHEPEKFEEFKARYIAELKSRTEQINRLHSIASKGELTLLYGAKDTHNNQAVVLLEHLKTQKNG